MTVTYDPPTDLNFYETGLIGQSLNGHILEMAAGAAFMEAQLRAQIGSHEAYTEEKVENAIKREWGQVQNAYKVLCRFVATPLEYDVFVAFGKNKAKPQIEAKLSSE